MRVPLPFQLALLARRRGWTYAELCATPRWWLEQELWYDHLEAEAAVINARKVHKR